jgi:lactoylglutathione lyase
VALTGVVLTPDAPTARPNDGFTLYFLGYDHGGDSVKPGTQFTREGVATDFRLSSISSYLCTHAYLAVLELTHNHGTESDPDFGGYASGNTEPGRGFGHIAITVPDIEAACERFERMGVTFKKRLTDGKMKSIAFILDPDGYWVEVSRFAKD